MSSTGIDQGAPAPPSRQTMRRVAFASFVGTAIEYYDFYIYGTAAALVFPKVFFPEQTPVIAALLSFATFGVAFFSRPVGAAIFGHFGDRIGRKRTLVATLLIMGFSTIAVGLIPPAAMIGVLAPILLVFFRFTQGFAVGGEWAGSALLSAEYAPPAKRGFYGMFTQLGVEAGLLLTNLIFLVVSTTIGEASDAFLSWGWRLPFLFSAVLVAVALYVRLNIEETPVFKKEKDNHSVSKVPLGDLFRSQPKQVLFGAGCMVGVFTFSFMGGTYLTGYASRVLEHPRWLVLLAGALGAIAMLIMTAISAAMCDKRGRRPIILLGFSLAVPWSFVVMPLLDTGSPALLIVGIMGTFGVLGITYGPMASFIPEQFHTRFRYTGAGLAFNLAGILGGAVPPLIATALLTAYGSWAIGAMLALLVGVSLVSTYALKETRGVSIQG